MKLKNIFISFLVVTGVLSSCNSEEPVGPQGDEEVALSLVLSVNDSGIEVTTKADSEISPTSDEQKIGCCHIAIFDDEKDSDTKGQLITSFDFRGDRMPQFNEETKRYTFSGLSIRTYGKKKRNVKVLVIANVDEVVNKSAITGTSYADYQKLVVTTSAFASDKLVKVGETTTSLNATTIVVPLSQLTAKVNWGRIEGGSGSSSVSYSWTTGGNDDLKDLIENNKNKLNAISDLGDDKIGSAASFDSYYYQFNKVWHTYLSRLHMVKVKCTETTGTSGTPTVIKVSVVGENRKSLLLIGDGGNTESQIATNASELTGTDKYFYTYENGLDNLKLNVDCAKTKTKVYYCYGIFRQDLLNWNWTPSLDAVGVEKIYTFVNKELKLITDSSVEWILEGESAGSDTQSYTIDLSSIDIRHGYSYTVTGTYEPEVSFGISWKIKREDGVEIKIPEFS